MDIYTFILRALRVLRGKFYKMQIPMLLNYSFACHNPSRIGMAVFKNKVYKRSPNAQIPIQMISSFRLGTYWTKSPKGVGINPGITKPIPFSIQIPIIIRTQERSIPHCLWRAGDKSIIAAVILKSMGSGSKWLI